MRLFVALLLALIAEDAVEFMYRRSDRFIGRLGDVAKFVRRVPKGLEIANVGSGPGMYAIDYKYCPIHGFNFSTAPQNFKYGYRILKRYHRNIKRNAIIIIIIMCPLSFGDNFDYRRPDYSDKYYYFLPWWSIDRFSVAKAYSLTHPLARSVLRRATALVLRKTKSGIGEQVHQEVGRTLDEPPIIRCWKSEFGLANLTDPNQADRHEQAFEEKIQILQEELDFCKEKTWHPILVVPPVPAGTREYISEEFLEQFTYHNIEILMSNNPGLQLLNYYDLDLPADCFGGDIFLNERGRELFSKRLFYDINQIFEGA